MKITSEFAILDVTSGRKKLAAHFKNQHCGPCPEKLRIPVVITGFIEGPFGNDDGTSMEFNVAVTSAELKG